MRANHRSETELRKSSSIPAFFEEVIQCFTVKIEIKQVKPLAT